MRAVDGAMGRNPPRTERKNILGPCMLLSD